MAIVLKNKQQGVVLVVSLVFLIALTSVAVMLMQNTTFDIKMSGASEEKTVATQESISTVDQIIYKQIRKEGTTGGNDFSLPVVKFKKDDPDNAGQFISETISQTGIITYQDTTAELSHANPNFLEPDCPHSKRASSVQVFTCNALNVRVKRLYGRNNNSEIVVNSGIAQELLRN